MQESSKQVIQNIFYEHKHTLREIVLKCLNKPITLYYSFAYCVYITLVVCHFSKQREGAKLILQHAKKLKVYAYLYLLKA